MVDVLLYNMSRIHDLWGIFLAHLLEVLGSPKAALRTAALDALGKAINGALAQPLALDGLGGMPPTANTRLSQMDREAAVGVEHMLLVALTALYTPDREVDVRLGVLRVALTVLQRHGAQHATGFLHGQFPKKRPSHDQRLCCGWFKQVRS